MITLNLLPDIKKEYLKANRTKRTMIMFAFLISASVVAVVVLMALYVFGVQKLQISNSQGSIDQNVKTLTETEDLAKVVTIQNQLKALPLLYDGTVKASRLFDFLSQVTPNNVSLSSVGIDYEDYSVEIKGTGTDIKSVNIFVDTLKLAGFTHIDSQAVRIAFTSVVLDSIGTEENESGFSVNFTYEPTIFDPNVEWLKFVVPEVTSTRSQTEKPKSLFDSSETQ